MSIHLSEFKANQDPAIHDLDRRTGKHDTHPKQVRLSTALFGLFLGLVLLKQIHVLAISWWWICLPIYLIPIGYGSLIIFIILICLWQELRHRLRQKWRLGK